MCELLRTITEAFTPLCAPVFSMSVKLEVEKLCSLMDRQLEEETKKGGGGGTNLLSDVLRKYTIFILY